MDHEQDSKRIDDALRSYLDGDETGISSLLSDLGELPGERLSSLLEGLAKGNGAGAVHLLEKIGMEGQPAVALAAVQSLGLIRDSGAAGALERLAAEAAGNAVRKAARRALHRLSSLGVAMPGPQPAPRAEPSSARRVAAAHASIIDGAGNRGVWYSLRLGQEVEAISLLINDESGIKDAVAWETSGSRYHREIDKLIHESEMPWIEIPADYARYLIEEAHGINARSRSGLPFEYLAWRDRIGRPEQSYEQPLVYSVINAAEVRWNPQYLDASGGILESDLFMGWLLEKDELADFVREAVTSQQSGLILPGAQQEARDRPAVDRAIQKLFDRGRRARYKRRLEEMAYALWKMDRGYPARVVLSAALAMEPADRPLHDHPFVRELVGRSLEVAVALAEGERTRTVGPGIDLHLPY